jgi:type IV pilus assembly protein PilO
VASLPRVVILTMHDVSLSTQLPIGANGEPPPGGQLVLQGTVKTYRYLEDEESGESKAAKGKGKARGRK